MYSGNWSVETTMSLMRALGCLSGCASAQRKGRWVVLVDAGAARALDWNWACSVPSKVPDLVCGPSVKPGSLQAYPSPGVWHLLHRESISLQRADGGNVTLGGTCPRYVSFGLESSTLISDCHTSLSSPERGQFCLSRISFPTGNSAVDADTEEMELVLALEPCT